MTDKIEDLEEAKEDAAGNLAYTDMLDKEIGLLRTKIDLLEKENKEIPTLTEHVQVLTDRYKDLNEQRAKLIGKHYSGPGGRGREMVDQIKRNDLQKEIDENATEQGITLHKINQANPGGGVADMLGGRGGDPESTRNTERIRKRNEALEQARLKNDPDYNLAQQMIALNRDYKSLIGTIIRDPRTTEKTHEAAQAEVKKLTDEYNSHKKFYLAEHAEAIKRLSPPKKKPTDGLTPEQRSMRRAGEAAEERAKPWLDRYVDGGGKDNGIPGSDTVAKKRPTR